VGLDHQQFLGPDVRTIAGEKAGILKDGRPVVVGRMRPEALSVVLEHALRTGSEVHYAETAAEPRLPDEGPYQTENRATARKILEVLSTLPEWDRSRPCALAATTLPATGHFGRWQWLPDTRSGARVLADCAHNVDGLAALFSNLPETTALHIVFGTVSDKDLSGVFPLLPQAARFYFCAADIPRALPAAELARQAKEQGLEGTSYASVAEAYAVARAKAQAGSLVLITGSIFVVAEALPQG
jgi:dihydrofolate synthase/folylpolyglutamate synthase